MWQSILGMLGNMGGSGGAGGMLGGAAGGGGASLMKGLGAAANYYNGVGQGGMQAQQQPQGMSLMDALAKQKQFREHAVMKKMADYEPVNIPAQATSGIQSMTA